ncbi:RbsD/FucU family protein [Vreelandella titanicae]|uniref:RbsD/FucU family protein n=1 Tax=Vreelandella titanicae TaxID=664683 RepID=UPI001F27FAE0|nr:RbsD/FucU family protein [Halomonas titanicae]MCE7517702.1 RbsD/FucU family protein [Halomonas titanicae]|tara:strand:- start:4053 stop:4487 length:435 start_codon:yes stop_codon:yes gene_type:complete
MMKGNLLHPELLSALAGAGHGSQILIADALYPHSTGVSSTAAIVHLNLRAGMVPAADVLKTVAETIHIEAATYMQTAEGGASEAVQEFQQLLAQHVHGGGEKITWSSLARMEFYTACREPDVCLLVATGETRPYANLLLTVGVP